MIKYRLTVIHDIGNRESFGCVFLVGFELDPELFGSGSECKWSLCGLTGLVCQQGILGCCDRQNIGNTDKQSNCVEYIDT